MMSRPAVLAAAVAALFASAVQAAPLYHVIDLGHQWSQLGLAGLNNMGDAVGTTGQGSVLLYHGDTHVVEDKGTIGGNYAIVGGINDQQTIVGYSTTLATQTAASFEMTASGTQVSARRYLSIGGINDAGFASGFRDGFTYLVDTNTRQGRATGALPTANRTQPRSINSVNGITGFSANDTAGWARGFYWHDGHMTDLGELVEGGGSDGWATNASGVTVGWANVTTGSHPIQHAIIYTPEDGIRDMAPELAGGIAYDVNAAGHAVGTGTQADGTYIAFYYDGSTAVNLTTLLDASGAGWIVTDARFINDAGQILGMGLLGGKSRGLLLTPVTP